MKTLPARLTTLLDQAIQNSDTFGTSYIKAGKELFEMNDEKWTPECEKYIFNKVVEK